MRTYFVPFTHFDNETLYVNPDRVVAFSNSEYPGTHLWLDGREEPFLVREDEDRVRRELEAAKGV